jgi:hypothetical protein
MIISNLKIDKNKTTFLINNKEIYLNYDSKYEQYVSSNYDGPLLLALPIAMRNKENIIIKGKISYKFFHNIKFYLMKIITIIMPECEIINIEADEFSYGENYNNTSVGCGLSCGIDSLCCLQDYYFDMEEGPYKLTHVTNFHAGASGNSEIVFNKRVSNSELYCNETSLNMLKVVTNFTSINNLSHQKIHVLRNLAIPLLFQKLFCKYYFSSGQSYPDDRIFKKSFNIKDLEVQHILFDPIIMNLISTENLEFIIHGSQYTRPEKTKKIAENSHSYKYLDVCVNGNFVEKNNKLLNCSECWKCMQTLVTLDYYGKLDNYGNIFELNKYYKNKESYLKNLKEETPYQEEILELYKKNSNK